MCEAMCNQKIRQIISILFRVFITKLMINNPCNNGVVK